MAQCLVGRWQLVGRRRSTIMFRSIPNKRDFLARVLWAIGGTSAARANDFQTATRADRIDLSPHRGAWCGPILRPGDLSNTRSRFVRQVEWLHNRARLLTV